MILIHIKQKHKLMKKIQGEFNYKWQQLHLVIIFILEVINYQILQKSLINIS